MTATLKHASYVPGTYTKARPDYVLTAEKYMEAWGKKRRKATMIGARVFRQSFAQTCRF
jgi:hypothetical protein